MTKKIYALFDDNNKSLINNIYNWFMLVCIVASMIPLVSKQNLLVFDIIDKVTVTFFIIDYILRLITARESLQKGAKSFLLYPFTPMAIIDLLTILPSFVPINAGFKALRTVRMIRTFKVFRSFKAFRYSKNVTRIIKVISNQKKPLLAVFGMAIFYILFTALVMFNLEAITFKNFFEAIYWASISLTSVGYGDIIPTTNVGRLFTILSALMGVAVVALPSGIITAGYLNVLNEEKEEEKDKEE